MGEGLVDAAVVAGVLSPKGKASPQEEPLFKIKAAAEAFRDLRRSIAETLEVLPFVDCALASNLSRCNGTLSKQHRYADVCSSLSCPSSTAVSCCCASEQVPYPDDDRER